MVLFAAPPISHKRSPAVPKEATDPLVPVANVTWPVEVIFVAVTVLLTPKLPVTFELANNSIVPVPTVLISKLLFELVVSMRLPTICISSVRNGPPTISPVTYNVPLTVALLLTDKLVVVTVPVTVSSPVTVNVEPLKVKLVLSIKRPLAPA